MGSALSPPARITSCRAAAMGGGHGGVSGSPSPQPGQPGDAPANGKLPSPHRQEGTGPERIRKTPGAGSAGEKKAATLVRRTSALNANRPGFSSLISGPV